MNEITKYRLQKANKKVLRWVCTEVIYCWKKFAIIRWSKGGKIINYDSRLCLGRSYILGGWGVNSRRWNIVILNLLSLFSLWNGFSLAIIARALASCFLWLGVWLSSIRCWKIEKGWLELHDNCGHVVASGAIADSAGSQAVVKELKKIAI